MKSKKQEDQCKEPLAKEEPVRTEMEMTETADFSVEVEKLQYIAS